MKGKSIVHILIWFLFNLLIIFIFNYLGFCIYQNTTDSQAFYINLWNYLSSDVFRSLTLSIMIPLLAFGVHLIFQRYEENRKNDSEKFTVIERYIDPISSICVSLLWRLNEILVKNDNKYLLNTENNLSYNTYKRRTTIYRIASLLGWIRGFELELIYFKISNEYCIDKFNDAIIMFKNSLADGADICKFRIENLAKKIGFQIPQDEGLILQIGRETDDKIYEFYKKTDDFSNFAIYSKEFKEKFEFVQNILSFLHEKINFSFDLKETNLDEILSIICIKEAWLFREWQNSIGDEMLKVVDNRERRYDVLNYKEFIKKFNKKIDGIETSNFPWINRFFDLFRNLDFSDSEEFDARIRQWKSLNNSIANLVLILYDINKNFNIFSNATIDLAKKIMEIKK